MDLQRFGGMYSRLHLAVDSYDVDIMRERSDLAPRFGRFICHCDDYAKYEICPTTCALERTGSFPVEEKWGPSKKITKGPTRSPNSCRSLGATSGTSIQRQLINTEKITRKAATPREVALKAKA